MYKKKKNSKTKLEVYLSASQKILPLVNLVA